MKTLILDYAKWRCGGSSSSKNKIGKGVTMLHNGRGFECCLGQFTKQINPDVTNEELKKCACPGDLRKKVDDLNKAMFGDQGVYPDSYLPTKLSRDAIDINDNTKTTYVEKIRLLKTLFKQHHYHITVINMPYEDMFSHPIEAARAKRLSEELAGV